MQLFIKNTTTLLHLALFLLLFSQSFTFLNLSKRQPEPLHPTVTNTPKPDWKNYLNFS